MRPSSRKPIRRRPWKPARAEPRKYSSARLIRSMTGRPTLRAISAGIAMTG